MDENKILPDRSTVVKKIKFLDETDKSGGKFLMSALTAIIERFEEDGFSANGKKKTKGIAPDTDKKTKNQKIKNN